MKIFTRRSILHTLSLCFMSYAFSIHASEMDDAAPPSPHWSLENAAHGWNSDFLVKTYFHNSELQRQWAWELLGKYGLTGTERILDFGCGDGKISAEMSHFVPHGSVTGVDISSDMLSFAHIKFPKYAYPNLHFQKSNSLVFSDSPASSGYDIVTSFCVFHLVSSPIELLQNIKKQIKPNGVLLAVIPAGKNPAFFEAANLMFEKYGLTAPWDRNQGNRNQAAQAPAAAAAAPARTPTMRTLEGVAHILKQAKYEILFLEMVDTDNPFYSQEELIAWMVGNTTANWNIPPSLSRDFFTDLVEMMCLLDPGIQDNEGRLHFKLSRIHLIATPMAQNYWESRP